MICLNDGETIAQSVSSLQQNNIARLIIVDGGSQDDTAAKIRSLGIDVISSAPGIRVQVLRANDQIESEFVFAAEADQEYHPELVTGLLDELRNQGLDGIQVTKTYSGKESWFERSHGRFLEIHRSAPGPTNFMSGPQLWRSSIWKDLILSTSVNEGFSFDTELSRRIGAMGLKVGVSELESEEVGKIDFRDFLDRIKNYGYGDYWFYRTNKGAWSFQRRLMSVLHIARRYFIAYPLKALMRRNLHRNLVLYLWLIGLLRYFFWIMCIAQESFSRFSQIQNDKSGAPG
ncbi:MAG: glycosyltransferase [Pontimonas sp.]